MWFLFQGTIIVLVVAYFHDKTPNLVARGILGGAAAYAATWLILWLKGHRGLLRWW
jgi:hypothetical protein